MRINKHEPVKDNKFPLHMWIYATVKFHPRLGAGGNSRDHCSLLHTHTTLQRKHLHAFCPLALWASDIAHDLIPWNGLVQGDTNALVKLNVPSILDYLLSKLVAETESSAAAAVVATCIWMPRNGNTNWSDTMKIDQVQLACSSLKGGVGGGK